MKPSEDVYINQAKEKRTHHTSIHQQSNTIFDQRNQQFRAVTSRVPALIKRDADLITSQLEIQRGVNPDRQFRGRLVQPCLHPAEFRVAVEARVFYITVDSKMSNSIRENPRDLGVYQILRTS